MSEIVGAALMGLVEGLTEYIPVSSTGHLILFGHLISFSKGETFEIVIQFGAILAVVVLYWRRFLGLFSEGSGFRGKRGIALLSVGCAPAMLVGILFHKTITSYLFSPVPVALALIVGGIAMRLLEKRVSSKIVDLDAVSFKHAAIVGLVQCFALWPGISRSGSSIIGGLLCGLSKKVSAEFSFLLAVPMLTTASFYQLYKSWEDLSFSDLPAYSIGLFVSFLTAVLAIKFFLSILSKYSFAPFAWYRIGLGVLVLILLW